MLTCSHCLGVKPEVSFGNFRAWSMYACAAAGTMFILATFGTIKCAVPLFASYIDSQHVLHARGILAYCMCKPWVQYGCIAASYLA